MNFFKMLTALAVTLLVCGCYDLEDGSSAGVLNSPQRNGKTIMTECQPESNEFNTAKSGEPCDFSGGCGWMDSGETSNDPRFQIIRELNCIGGFISAEEGFLIQNEPPRNDVHWVDCSALSDGRTGESCQGSFFCYQEASQDCLKLAICAQDLGADNDSLKQLEICDSRLDIVNDNPLISNCEEAVSAVPNDPCQGHFLCTQNGPVEFSESQGYHLDDFPGELRWCDGTIVHIMSNVYPH